MALCSDRRILQASTRLFRVQLGWVVVVGGGGGDNNVAAAVVNVCRQNTRTRLRGGPHHSRHWTRTRAYVLCMRAAACVPSMCGDGVAASAAEAAVVAHFARKGLYGKLASYDVLSI